jgi:hypothetical protein
MRKLLFVFGFTTFYFIGNAQNFIADTQTQTSYYYYYEGKKQYLSLHTGYAFLSIKEQQLPDSIRQRNNISAITLRSDHSDKKQYQTRNGTSRYYTELKFNGNLSDEQYLNLLTDIKRQNEDAVISPYFKTKSGDKIGLSNFFYVKLKEMNDTTLLRQMAEQTGCIIIEQDSFMPLWFILNTTEASELNALEAANFFYESDLFQAAEPDLMVQYTTCCVNDVYFGFQWGLKNTGQYGGTAGIDISHLPAGVYYLKITGKENTTIKIIKL